MDGFSAIYQQKCIQLQLQPIKAILVLFEKASKRGGQITQLDLSYKSLDSRAIIPIASALQYNITITSLNLGYNLIEKRGCKALAVALATNTTLTHLDLSGNRIGDDGIKHLADALSENCTLSTLLLKNNGIRDAGVCDMASALTVNSSLLELDLSQNTILSTGGEALATALTHNNTLVKLNLSHTRLPQPAIAAIVKSISPSLSSSSSSPIFSSSSSIRHLDVRGNPIDDEALLSRLALIPPISSTSTNHRPPSPARGRSNSNSAPNSNSHLNTRSLRSSTGGLGNDDAELGEHLASLTRSLKKEISLLEPEAEFLSKKLSMKLEDITNFSSSLSHPNPVFTEPVESSPTVDMPDTFDTSLHQPAHTVATLRQLNFHYQQQIADLQRQLKTQAQSHKRQLSNSQQNGINSEDNLRAILVDHKETITRLEKELTEKSKKAVTHSHDIEHIKYTHEQELKALRVRNNEKIKQAREGAQGQYDELCADYREYQLKSKAEFMALFNEYEAFKRQYSTLQNENSRVNGHVVEQNQFIDRMQAQADGWQDRLDAVVRVKDDEIRAKQEEIEVLRAENAKLTVWLQSMQKTVAEVRRPSSTITGGSGTPSRTTPAFNREPSSSSIVPPLSNNYNNNINNMNNNNSETPVGRTMMTTPQQRSRSPSKSSTSALLDQQLERLLEHK